MGWSEKETTDLHTNISLGRSHLRRVPLFTQYTISATVRIDGEFYRSNKLGKDI